MIRSGATVEFVLRRREGRGGNRHPYPQERALAADKVGLMRRSVARLGALSPGLRAGPLDSRLDAAIVVVVT